MSRRATALEALLILSGLVAVIGWNHARFVGADAQIRSKDLDFLPAPEMVRLLSVGHANSLSRLRWIDSFSYLQLQYDRKNDLVAGGGSGFRKLYDGLVALDPHFEPFYEHAATALSGILQRPGEALGYLQRGILEQPESFFLWQHAAAILVSNFQAEERHPLAFSAFLAAWAEAMQQPAQRQAVYVWEAALARRRLRGTEQLDYWLERLGATSPGSPLADFMDGVVREQLARAGETLFASIVATRAAAGLTSEHLADLLDPRFWPERRPEPAWCPLIVVDGVPRLRPDPYGRAWTYLDGVWRSTGLALADWQRRITGMNFPLSSAASTHGRWPTAVTEFAEFGLVIPAAPPGGRIVYANQALSVELDPPPLAAWPLR